MDDKQNKILEGMKKLKNAIEEYIDNMELDDADEKMKDRAKKKNPKDKEEPEED